MRGGGGGGESDSDSGEGDGLHIPVAGVHFRGRYASGLSAAAVFEAQWPQPLRSEADDGSQPIDDGMFRLVTCVHVDLVSVVMFVLLLALRLVVVVIFKCVFV